MDNDATQHTSTRIIGHRELVVDGVRVDWWAVGERPTLVTVRTSLFGGLAEFTEGDPAQCAEALAKKLLARHYRRTERTAPKDVRGAIASALEKPGWFQRGEPDLESTIF
ncbi:MAG TPA: hypothetical protein VHH11_10105 [Gammaproteobacteria bacterium]|nr:hypothetical protein [Gammaproteobacteria bacterium]